jgi:hypothetical protein
VVFGGRTGSSGKRRLTACRGRGHTCVSGRAVRACNLPEPGLLLWLLGHELQQPDMAGQKDQANRGWERGGGRKLFPHQHLPPGSTPPLREIWEQIDMRADGKGAICRLEWRFLGGRASMGGWATLLRARQMGAGKIRDGRGRCRHVDGMVSIVEGTLGTGEPAGPQPSDAVLLCAARDDGRMTEQQRAGMSGGFKGACERGLEKVRYRR